MSSRALSLYAARDVGLIINAKTSAYGPCDHRYSVPAQSAVVLLGNGREYTGQIEH